MLIEMFRIAGALALGFVVADRPANGSSLAVTYLQQASDRYQNTVDVYTVADAAGNHFAARGEFDNSGADLVPAMDEISSSASCLGITCITAAFDPGHALWGGWYFMNGVLGPTAQEPSPNWGNIPNAGYDLTGATALRFWAKGAVGGEVVHFFAFGVGNTAQPFQPYPDSSDKVEVPNGAVTLSTTWTQYQIPLAGLDIHYVLGGFGWLAVTSEQASMSVPITFYLDNIQYLKARPNDPRLLVSYETIKSTNSFDTVERNAAYVYDNSVALIALLAAGDLAHARTIADALLYGQGHDRFFTDGRVRNAYQGGDISLPSGWLPNNLPNTVRMPGWYDPGRSQWFEDETDVSTTTGNVAWAGVALLNIWEVTRDSEYLAAAEALGNWVIVNAAETRSGAARQLGGFTGGYDGWENGAASAGAKPMTCASGVFVNGQCKRLYKSAEHNIDLYSMFSRLYLADGEAQWAKAAQQAKHCFLSMWDPQEGKFWTGTSEDGVTVSTDVIPLDIQAWALQALGTEAQPYLQSLAYIEAHHKTSLGYGFKQNGGNACGDNTWFEGTSQVSVAYLLANNRSKWQSILDDVHSAQTTDGGIPATDGACLTTGFTLDDGSPWEYFPRIHVAATGWLALAENGVNPYRATLYSPEIAPSALAFWGPSRFREASSGSITLSNPGVGPLSIQSVALSGADASDFQQTNDCGSTLPGGGGCVIKVSFKPTVAETRNATLTVTESSDPAMVPAVLSVSLTGGVRRSKSPFSLSVNSSSVTFNYPVPTPPPSVPPISVTSSTGSVTVTPSLGAGCSWLTLSPTSGNTPVSFTPSINTAVAATLAAGNHPCNVTFSSTRPTASTTLPATLIVASPATLVVSPNSWTFDYPPPVLPPNVPPFVISSSAGTVTVTSSLGSGCSWLTLTASSWNTPVSVNPVVNAAAAAPLTPGSYPCTVTFTAAGTTGTATLLLTLVVASPVVSNPSIQGVVQGCQVHGTVAGVNPPQSFEVVVYALTNAYYIQPCVTEPITPIALDGTWGPVDSHNGAIYAILVKAGYSPPTLTGSLPPVDGVNVLAVTGPVGTIAGCDVARCPAQ